MLRNFRGIALVSAIIILILLSPLSIFPVAAAPIRDGARQNSAPVAVIDEPGNGEFFEVDEVITFDGSSSNDPDNDSLTYSWNFGDSESGTGKITTHSYGLPFVYVIRLTVSDGDLNDTDIAVIIVGGGGGQNQPPTADIATPSNGDRYDAFETIFFDGSTSSDPEDDPLTYNWDFGDDNSSNDVATSHEYSETGIYFVTLTVNDGMYNDSTRIMINIDNMPPIADAGGDQQAFAGEDVIFDGSNSTDPDPTGRVVNWTWDLDNGDMGYGEVFTYVYKQKGSYSVTLTVLDNDNASGSDTIQALIFNAKPVASLVTNPSSTIIDENIEFDATGSYDVDGFISDYYYDFGDGVETGWISNQIITHSYASEGIYETSLRVRDNEKMESEPVTANVQITTEPIEPPTVIITYPTSGEHVAEEIKIEGTAHAKGTSELYIQVQIDNLGWVNGTVININTGTNTLDVDWVYFWDTEDVDDGDHTIRAKAFDGFQYSQELSVGVVVVNLAVNSIAITISIKPSTVQPQQPVEVSGKATYDTGVSVSNTEVEIEIVGQSASWTTTTNSKGQYEKEIQAPGEPESYTIKATITDGTLSDSSQTKLTVQKPPDLVITGDDITFSKTKPVLGDKIKITLKIHNNGDQEGTGTVEVFDADKSNQDSDLIKSFSVTIAGSDTATITVNWAPKSEGKHTILVTIKDVSPSETILTNNQASAEYDILGKPGEDEDEAPFADALTALDPIADQVGGLVYLLGIIGGAIVVVVIVIAVVTVSKKRSKSEEDTKSEKEPRKPAPPPSSEERVVFTEVS
jgi:PKD repeat protein